MKSRDSRDLEIPPGGREASHALADYYSDRSVALVISGDDGGVAIGSGICVKLEELYLVATAAHNLRDVSNLHQVRALPRGDRSHPGLKLNRHSHVPESNDLAWIELDSNDVLNYGQLRFLELEDFGRSYGHNPEVPFWIQGYPSGEVEVEPSGATRPMSLCLMTNSLPSEDRDDWLAFAYPPDSPDDVGLELVAPLGFSGGAVWTHPRFVDTLVWSPEQSRCVAITVKWSEGKKRLLAQPIERWLNLVARDFPETKAAIEEKLESDGRRQTFISPHFLQGKLDDPSVEDLIDILEDRVNYWVLEPARSLLDNPFGFSAAFCILLTYFEGIWGYVQGRDSTGRSKRFFIDAFIEVFRSGGLSDKVSRRVAEILYRDARCGFFHDGVVRDRVYFGAIEGGAILVTLPKVGDRIDEDGEIQSIIVDPQEILAYVEGHFKGYIEKLRDTSNQAARSSFESFCRTKWDWESDPRIVAG